MNTPSSSKNASSRSRLSEILSTHEAELLTQWMDEQLSAGSRRKDLMKESELRDQSRQFLTLLRSAASNGNLTDTSRAEWTPVREFIAEISRTRASQGFNPSETATFIFSLRAPLLDPLIKHPDGAADLRAATVLMDKLGLHTVEEYQKSRKRSSTASSRKCSSCPPRWCGCSKVSWRCP